MLFKLPREPKVGGNVKDKLRIVRVQGCGGRWVGISKECQIVNPFDDFVDTIVFYNGYEGICYASEKACRRCGTKGYTVVDINFAVPSNTEMGLVVRMDRNIAVCRVDVENGDLSARRCLCS